MSAPLVSIILVCRNPGLPLHTALNSAWAQRGPACEVIVIDGASSDGTRDWLESQRHRLDSLTSAPDRGIYDAMNKGVTAARGDWVIFIGADDRLQDDIVSHIAPTLRQTTAGIVAGEAVYDDGRVYRPGKRLAAIRRNFLHHQATFYRRTLFATHGGFQTDLQIMADYEFNLRLAQTNVGLQEWQQRVATCGSGGLSDGGSWAVYREEIHVRHRYFPTWQCWGWDLVSVLRYLRKKILRNLASV